MSDLILANSKPNPPLMLKINPDRAIENAHLLRWISEHEGVAAYSHNGHSLCFVSSALE